MRQSAEVLTLTRLSSTRELAGSGDVEDAAPMKGGEPDGPTKPVADRLLIGFLPFITVKELRTNWLGLTDSIPDDGMTCGDYQLKHGGAAAAPATGAPE